MRHSSGYPTTLVLICLLLSQSVLAAIPQCVPFVVAVNPNTFSITNNEPKGQSFVISCSGTLNSISVVGASSPTADTGTVVQAELIAGSGFNPGSVVLATSTFVINSNSPSQVRTFTFTGGVVLVAGTYTLRFSRDTANGNVGFTGQDGGSGDTYTDGTAFTSTAGTSTTTGLFLHDVLFSMDFTANTPDACVPPTATLRSAVLTGDNRYGQEIHMPCAGDLNSIDLGVYEAANQATDRVIVVDVFLGSGYPADNTNRLGTSSYTMAGGDPTLERFLHTFTFTPPITFNAGDIFTVRISLPTSTAVSGDGGGTFYPTGSAFLSALTAASGGATKLFYMPFALGITPTAVVVQAQGDPHLIGLAGQHFDFDGQPNKTFSFLSSRAVQLNAFFDRMKIVAQPPIFEGTYIMDISIQLVGASQSIVVHAGNSSFDDHPSVWVGDVEIQPTTNNMTNRFIPVTGTHVSALVSVRQVDIQSAMVGLEEGNDRIVAVVAVDIVNFASIEIYCVENGYHWHGDRLKRITSTSRRNLDVSITLHNRTIQPTGVLGSTLHATNTTGPFKLKGVMEDYIVRDGLLGHDSNFNLFQG